MTAPHPETRPGRRLEVWSCGGGTQSAAIAALIVKGDLPRPAVAVMVDTEREKSATFRYARAVLVPELAGIGVVLRIVPKSRFATVDLHRQGKLLLPVFTTQTGKVGKLPTYCSNEWKQRVVRRYLRHRGVKSCRQWLGISLDEADRMRDSDVQWIENVYPLVDRRLRREDCLQIVASLGWPKPPRSACYMCPNQRDEEWRQMKEEDPEDWERACLFDERMRRLDPHFFLHHSGTPLRGAELTAKGTPFDGGCSGGVCFV